MLKDTFISLNSFFFYYIYRIQTSLIAFLKIKITASLFFSSQMNFLIILYGNYFELYIFIFHIFVRKKSKFSTHKMNTTQIDLLFFVNSTPFNLTFSKMEEFLIFFDLTKSNLLLVSLTWVPFSLIGFILNVICFIVLNSKNFTIDLYFYLRVLVLCSALNNLL